MSEYEYFVSQHENFLNLPSIKIHLRTVFMASNATSEKNDMIITVRRAHMSCTSLSDE